MSECKICKGFIGLNICLKCGLKQGAIAKEKELIQSLKDELTRWLPRATKESPERIELFIIEDWIKEKEKELGGETK